MSESAPTLPYVDYSNIGPAVGNRFPDVILPNQAGDTIDLHTTRASRRAVIVFHRSALW